MEKWDDARRLMIEGDLCLFFKKDGRLYGATETARITFARMKNPENNEDSAWGKDATFVAYDLERFTEKDEKKSVFGASDLPDIKPLDEDEAKKILKKMGKEMPAVSDGDDDEDKPYGEE